MTITIIKDREPYRSPVTGEVISGRRQEREHMKKHDVVHYNETVGRQNAEKRNYERMMDERNR